MLMREYMDILVAEGKKYRNERLIPEMLTILSGQRINEFLVVVLVYPYICQLATKLKDDADAIKKLQQAFVEFVPDAMASVKRNTHMNMANGSGILDEEHADALLVSFINFASFPCDLALYTRDLLPE